MINSEVQINSTVIVPFTSQGLLTGVSSFTLMVLKDGVLYTSFATAPVLQEYGNGLYAYTFVFNATGEFTIFVDWGIQAYIKVVALDTFSLLGNIQDALLGSWALDKTTGVITLYRKNGSVLDTYNFSDTTSATSRELLT